MFTAEGVFPDVSVRDIFEKVSQYDIFKKYCSNFEDINKSFKSDLYKDHNASCRIYPTKIGLAYKDHGNGDHFTCIHYVARKFNCTYREALNIISADFGIIKTKLDIKPNLLIGRENSLVLTKKLEKPVITIVPRRWTLYDYNYWFKKYGITFDWLDSYEVIPCNYVFLHKYDSKVAFPYSKSNPIYAYRVENENGEFGFKIYKPLEREKKYKWMSSINKSMIQGYKQLPDTDDILIITKSLKDVICSRLCGYSAIALASEGVELEKNIADKLQNRFKKIILLYDYDEKGIEASAKISNQYGYRATFIPEDTGCKDLADFIEKNGLEEAKKLLKELLR